MRRKLATAAAVIAVVLAVIAGRVVVEGRAALRDGDAAAARGDQAAAVRAWREAAIWYLPLAPHVDDAGDRLRAAGAHTPARPRAATAWLAAAAGLALWIGGLVHF